MNNRSSSLKLLATSLLAGTLWVSLTNLIHSAGVNIFFSDQWDYLLPVVEKSPLTKLFTHQHGPHRMGLGLILDAEILRHFSWSALDEGYTVASCFLISTILALGLSYRLTKRLDWTDLLVPLLFLLPSSYELLIATPSLSHSPLPVLLTLLAAFMFTIEGFTWRWLSLLLISELLLFTGFGFFSAAVILVLAIHDMCRQTPSKTQKIVLFSIVLVLSLSFGLYFQDYRFDASSQCQTRASETPLRYLQFFFLAYNKFFGSFQSSGIFFTIGALITLLLFGFTLKKSVTDLLKRPNNTTVTHPILLLALFSLTFVASAAVARTCAETLAFAQSSRYLPIIGTGVFACFLGIKTLAPGWLRQALMLLICLVCTCGYLRNKPRDELRIREITATKAGWKHCLSEGNSVEKCLEIREDRIHPALAATKYEPLLSFLKKQKLGPYSEKN